MPENPVLIIGGGPAGLEAEGGRRSWLPGDPG